VPRALGRRGIRREFLSTITSGIGHLLKLLFFAALVCVAVLFAWKYREQVRRALAQLWQDLQQLWASLWGRRPETDAETSAPSDQPAGPPVPSFASYQDPFAAGTAERYTTEQLVCYSFEALEAWGRGTRLCTLGRTDTVWSMHSSSPVITPQSVRRRKCWPISTADWPTAGERIGSSAAKPSADLATSPPEVF